MRIAAKYVQFWMGTAILKSDYEKADAVYEVHEFLSRYGL